MHKVDWVEANGVWLRYADDGEGDTTLILLHELGGTIDSWDYILDAFTDRYRVLRYDMRGFGMSEKVTGSYGLEDAIKDLEDLIKAMAISGSIVLVGAAVGAGIAMRMAAKHPRKINGLIALAPATEIAPERLDGAKKLPDMMDKFGLRALIDASLEEVFPDVFNADPERILRFAAQQGSADPDGYKAAYQMLLDGSYRPFLPNIECPTLVAAGIYDPIRPPELVEPVAKLIPNVVYKTVESGHFMAIQTPELAIEIINEGLARAGV